MPLLAFDDELPARPQRVVVAGTSGAGKSTLAARIGVLLDIPYTEIDGLYHGPGWVPRPSFVADVEALAASPRWVTEWQYGLVRPLLAGRSDLMVWLDPPLPVVMRQVIQRTLRRRLRREKLWNGNVERPLFTILTDRQHIIRWAWDTRNKTQGLVAQAHRDHPDLPILRLRSHQEARAWLAGPLSRSGPA